MSAPAATSGVMGRAPVLRLPSLAALRAAPGLSLPPPAGNSAQQAMPAAGPDWVLALPRLSDLPLAALDRPCLRPQGNARGEGETSPSCPHTEPDPGTSSDPAGEPGAPAAGPSGQSVAAGAPFSFENPPAEAGSKRCCEAAAGRDAAPPAGAVPGRANAPALPGTGTGGSIASVLECRLDQLRQGHTPESDAALSLKALTTKVRFFADKAREFAFAPHVDGDHAAMRDKLVRTAALALAAIDALDFQSAKGTTGV